MAADGARAAGGDAGDRIPQQRVSRRARALRSRISSGAGRIRLCRGPDSDDRVSLCRGPLRSSAVACVRSCASPGGGDRCDRRHGLAACGKGATTTISIVFVVGSDPVKEGLVASFNRPGGNITGVSIISSVLVSKQLELLHELVPQAAVVGIIVNPSNPNIDFELSELQSAAQKIGVQLAVHRASTGSKIETAFSTLVQRAGALLVEPDTFFLDRREQLVALAARHAIPTMYSRREYAAIGGLMSYGANLSDGYRQAGVYVGQILKGTKPADLLVMQPTKYQLTINLKTAKALGLRIPQALLTSADEVIE